MKSVLNIHWKDWCWSWSSNTLVTWREELTHGKRPWCWERLKAEEGDNRGWDGWMASPTQWTWVWASFRSWWWTGKPGVLQSMGSQRVRQGWASELNISVSTILSQFVLFSPSTVSTNLFSTSASPPIKNKLINKKTQWKTEGNYNLCLTKDYVTLSSVNLPYHMLLSQC